VGGPSSSFPRWWRSSTASCGPGLEELGAHPRSMGFRQRLCLLRLFSKPCGVRVPHDPSRTEIRRWCSAAASSSSRRNQPEDWRCRQSRDLIVFLLFVRGQSAKILLYVFFPDVFVFVCSLYPQQQYRYVLIKKKRKRSHLFFLPWRRVPLTLFTVALHCNGSSLTSFHDIRESTSLAV